MNIQDIISSGILEQYAIGLLSPEEVATVEQYLVQYPELKSELDQIESALESYALLKGIVPPSGSKDKIMKSLENVNKSIPPITDPITKSKNWIDYLSAILLGLCMITAWNLFQVNKQNNLLRKSIIICDSLQNTMSKNQESFFDLQNPSNKPIAFDATPAYKNQVVLFLLNNQETKKNYIQIVGVPQMAEDEVLQLWSLKPNADPMPLEIFRKGDAFFIETTYVEGTDAYAITIEPKGGSKVPNLQKLIGVAKV